MKVLALVPARGGSKSVKNKNLFPVLGVPLIQYTLDTALKSDLIDKIVVSSDSDEILNFVSTFPDVDCLKRPEELATDEASSIDVLIHALNSYSEQSFTHVIFMEPTSPLRSLELIKKTISLLEKYKATMTVIEAEGIYGFIRHNRFVSLVENESRRRQDREVKFKECSTLYGLEIDYFYQNKVISDPQAFPIVISKSEALDINSIEDIDEFRILLPRIKNKRQIR